MDIIYAPKGKAREYANLAFDIYTGCTHCCRYCYAKHYSREDFYAAAHPHPHIIDRLKKELKNEE